MRERNKIEIVLFVFLIIHLCGCSFFRDQKTMNQKKEMIQEPEQKDFVEPYVDENPIQLGLYVKENNNRNLVATYDSDLNMYQDIVSFEVYYTKESILLGGNQKDLWEQIYRNYENVDSYKIGYRLSFQAGEVNVDQTILNPSDTLSFFDYIQIYLYDDIHQDNGWYDHISQEEVTEDTRFTSIKLTASTKIAEITSPITLIVFTYDGDDFDEDGHYRGNSTYQVVIQRK